MGIDNLTKKKILFICTHNSARSQIAAGLLNALQGDQYDAHSAGIRAASVNPNVIKVMAELNIDISQHRLKNITEFQGQRFDYVVTVCDHARETCPFFPGDTILHVNFEDPSKFKGTEEEILVSIRRVRDEIQDWIAKTFGTNG